MTQQIATKEEERKALDKIRKIVESLGEQSYVGTAFTGAFEMAEENIENDFGSSTQAYIDGYREKDKEISMFGETLKEKDTMIKNLHDRLEDANEQFKKNHELENANAGFIAKERQEYLDRANKAEEKNKELAMEIITLKAKLYDLLVKETAA